MLILRTLRAASSRNSDNLKKMCGPPKKGAIVSVLPGTAVSGMFEGFENAVKSTAG